ncbi:hypothetical protein ACERK3_09695 [Phycisphaerales bacterium AB-hyl4]|uniref:Uncharacterized protein n=1 Tax=Natronomicrosphaera hydrolytica TaxID=3242702 RepID=A0ABV4U8G0_9BACT
MSTTTPPPPPKGWRTITLVGGAYAGRKMNAHERENIIKLSDGADLHCYYRAANNTPHFLHESALGGEDE